MIRGQLLCVVAALASSLMIGCGASRPPASAASTESFEVHETSTAMPDQDVPLTASAADDASPSAANPRLTAPRTIGENNDDPVYDRGRPRQSGGDGSSSQQLAANGQRPVTYRTRGGYARGGYGYNGRAVYGSTGSANPAVGGSFPAAKSFGPAAAR